jgi:Protein of unknown function (DUF2798)
MIPLRFSPILFGFILSSLMSFVVSGASTFSNAGLVDHLFSPWIGAWLPSWLFPFPVVLIIAPLARRIVSALVKPQIGRAQ